MPLVSVLCPSCAGKIQLDDAKESGFCLYCGNQVLVSEAIQKMKIQGEVSVSGIASLEKMLQNAEAFHKLGDLNQEQGLLLKLTKEYPGDYRAWWQLAQLFLSETKIWKGRLSGPDRDSGGDGYDGKTRYIYYLDGVLKKDIIRYKQIYGYAINAKIMAPPEVRSAIGNRVVNFFEGERKAYTHLTDINNQAEPLRKLVRQKVNDAADNAYSKHVKDENKKIDENNKSVTVRIKLSRLFVAIWIIVILCTLIFVPHAIFKIFCFILFIFLSGLAIPYVFNAIRGYDKIMENMIKYDHYDPTNGYYNNYYDCLQEACKELSIKDPDIRSMAGKGVKKYDESLYDCIRDLNEVITKLNEYIQKIQYNQ